MRLSIPCLIAFLAVPAVAANLPPESKDAEYLAPLTRKVRPDFLLGSFASGLDTNRADFAVLGEFFRRNFDVMTVGVYMTSTQPEPGKYSLERADALIQFAHEHQLKVHLHPLIGGAEYTPKWVNDGNLSPEALLALLQERITTVLTRYRGKIHYVDVVNESLTGQGQKSDGQFEWQEKAYRGGDHVWMKTLGMWQGKTHQFPNYLVESFRAARQAAGPEVKLLLNEWGNEATNSYRGKAFLALMKALRAEGIPVDAAGFQLHCRLKKGKLHGWATDRPFDFEAFDAMLRAYEQAGIEVHITEFDIHLEPNPPPEDFALQGKYYAQILQHALRSPAVKSFKTWGFTDRYSWKADGLDGHPLLLDEQFAPKPAYLRQAEMLKNWRLPTAPARQR